MKFFASKRTQRLTNFALAALLVVGTLTASVPFLFSQMAHAVAEPGYNVHVTTSCINGLVSFKITGNNPTAPAWVKSSADFKMSAPVHAAQGAVAVSIPLNDTTASVPASAVTIYYSADEYGQYQLLDDPTAVAPYAAFNCNNTVYVATPANGGDDAHQGTTAKTAFATIQKALDTVNAKGTVKVAAGSYNESVTVNKAVNIHGAQVHKDARGTRPGAESVINGNMTINASNVTVDGFTVNGTPDSAAFIMEGGNTVKKHTIYNTIINAGANSKAISYNSSHDTFSHNLIHMGPSSSSGIEANNNPGSNTQVIENTFTGSSSNKYAANINFIGALSSEIPASVPSNIVVSGNVSLNNSETFIAATFVNIFTITNNIVTNTDNGKFGTTIYLGGGNKNVTLKGNTLTGGMTAVKVAQYYKSTQGTFPTNSDIVAHNNNFSDNTNGFVVNIGAMTGSTVDATQNYWGSASGPKDVVANDGSTTDTNNNGTGSQAVGAVNYGPWYVDASYKVLSNAFLDAPTNLTPINNTYTSNPSFDNTWTPVAGASRYEYQATYVIGGVTTTYRDLSTASNYDISDRLVTRHNNKAPEATYSWQVRAYNAEGTPGAWTAAQNVTVDTIRPGAPSSILNDVNGIAITNGYINTKKFTFQLSNPSTEAVILYKVKYWNDITGSDFMGTNNAWSTTVGANGMYADNFTQGQGVHHFAFSACDAAGNCSPYSSPFTVTYDATPPTATITTLATTLGQNAQTTIDGSTGADAKSYALTLDGTLVASGQNFSPYKWDTTGLASGDYTFALTATDAAGNTSDPSTVVMTINQPATDTLTPTTKTLAVVTPATTSTNTVTPTITGPSQSSPAVLGATTANTDNTPADIGVKGTTNDKTLAAAVNSDANKGTIFGLAWFWWILILTALATIAWFIIATIRRRNEEQA